jgi:RHS repeat-associated protein
LGYSSENLALTESAGGSTITRGYDPLARLSSTVATGSTAPTDFLWFGDELIGEYFKGNVAGLYVHGPGVDEPLVGVSRYGTRTWFHADERGSVIAGSDPAGAASHLNTYDEYGRAGSPNGYRFGFTGQIRLAADRHYYKARMYDPGLGRFLQPDPIGYGGGMNLYAYVKGDPVNFVDPLGLEQDEPDIVINGKKLKADSPSLTGWAALMGSGRGGWGPTHYFDGNGGSGGGSASPAPETETIICVGKAYVLKGNSNFVGKEGFPNTTVTSNSAAVVVSQWTGHHTAGPAMRAIGARTSGLVSNPSDPFDIQYFDRLTDNVGEASIGNAATAQGVIMARAPGQLVLELVTGRHFGPNSSVVLFTPATEYGCPDGTSPVK